MSGTGISHVEFYLDGKRVGGSYFPLYEKREIPVETGKTETRMFEVWRLDGAVPSISTAESSLAFHVVAHTRGGGEASTNERLIRVIENRPPAVTITSPGPGVSVSVGQTVNVDMEMADDALALGLSVDLLMNGEVVDQFHFENKGLGFAGGLDLQRAISSFKVTVGQEMLGTTLCLQLEAVDFHGLVSRSEEIKLPVRADQPPGVAIANPVEGAHFVSGLPIEIRADATDDVGVERVDFYVEDRLAGSDDRAPFSCQYETIKGLPVEQSLKIFAIAVDSRAQEGRSAEVFVTLGKDEQPPVVNIVSPVITMSAGGDEQAEVVEASELVLKVAGYDNVKVDRLELRGIEKQANEYVLTGDLEHVLTGEEFAPQQIPGALHAFSALKLVSVPLFSRSAGISHDRYPVEITATDTAGNSSTAAIVIAVSGDSAPSIVNVRSDRDRYFAKDTVNLDVCARDDRGVVAIEVNYYVDGVLKGNSPQRKELTPAANVQANFSVGLDAFGLSNDANVIQAHIVAIDNKGLRSDAAGPFVFEIRTARDENGPLAIISYPVQGSTLYHGDEVAIRWKAVDESSLARIELFSDGASIYSRALTKASEKGQFACVVPGTGDEFLIGLHTTDVFGNESSTDWRYTLMSDLPPTVSIRNPAQGSRLVEGEHFTLSASVTDNQTVVSATFFIEQGGDTLFSKSFDETEIAAALKAGQYLSVGMRVSHRPDDGEQDLRIGVRATDDRGLVGEALLDLEILHDLEPPRIILGQPDGPFSVTPGTVFWVEGKGDDNFYIRDVVPLLIDGEGVETELSWSLFSREDRVETVTLPNPNSFGSTIVGQRFYIDFAGSIKLPFSYFDHVGKTYQFALKAQDHGVNETRTSGIELTIRGDEEGPEIRILEPGEVVVEGEPVAAHIQISDDISLASYIVYIDGLPDGLLAEATALETEFVELEGLEIDLSSYDPSDEENNHFTLVVGATDSAGNESRQVIVVYVQEDRAPRLSVVDEQPEDALVKGGLAFQTIRIEDDYVSRDAPLLYFPVYTSLKGLGSEGSRDPTGHIFVDADDSGVDLLPYITFNYPEANDLYGRLLVKGRPYIEAAGDGLLQVWPAPHQPKDGDNHLRLDFGPGHTVRYRVKTFQEFECEALTDERIVESPEGIDFSSLINYQGTSRINSVVIFPEVFDDAGTPVDTFIRSIRIDSRNLSGVTGYWTGSTTRILPAHQALVSVFVKDCEDGDAGKKLS